MKKITCVFLFLFALSMQISAQIIEDFEIDPPTGWTFMQTEADDPGFAQTSLQANSGTYSFYHNDDNIAVESTSWMISPALLVATGDILEFYYRHNFSPTYTVESGVWVSTTSADPIANPSDFTLLYDLGTNNSEDTWTLYTDSLDAYNGQTIYLAFKYVGDWADELYIDDFYAGVPPACPDPTDLMVDGITATTADVSWTAGSETEWEIVVQAAGTGVPTGSGTMTSSNPYTENALTAVTDYEVYVRANCGANGYSGWIGPINFTTLCDIFVPDYLEDFTTIIPNCWDEADNGDAITGPLDLGGGSWAADGYLNNGFSGAYKINLYASSKSDWILSPQFDLTGGPFQVDFDFALLNWGTTTAGTLGSDDTVQLFMSNDNGVTWINLVTFDNTSVIPATGTQVVYDLTAYSGQIVQFGILGSEGTVNDPEDIDVFVDNFRVRAIPSCLEPTGLTVSNIGATSADISWTPGGSETEWEVVIQPQGTGIPSGSGTITTSNPYTASGLTAVSDYEVYIRANCGDQGLSSWVGAVNFTTACDVFVPEYLEDFTTIIPNCWDEATNGDATTGPTGLGAGDWGPDEYLNIGTGDGAYKINLYASSKSDWILSPQIDLTGGPFQVDFDFAIMQWNSSTTAGTLGSDDTVELLMSNDNGATWINLLTFDNTSVIPATGTQVAYDLTAYSGQIVQFGILGSEGTVNDPEDIDVFVDNFRVRAIPSCLEPTNLSVMSVSETSVDISWTPGNTETNWNIELNADTDFTPGNGEEDIAGVASMTPNYTANGLLTDTTYYIYYQADCGDDGTSTWVGPFTFYNGYCVSVPSSNDGDGIGSVVLSDTTFTSAGDVTYEDFTATTVDLAQLVTANLQITFLTGWTYDTNVWIDFNNDLIFDNATELVFQGTSTNVNPTTLDASFVMPSTPLGVYRMRIGTADSGQFSPNPCYNGAYGVTADFSINITEPPSCIPPTYLTVANVGGTAADISWTANTGETAWEYVVQLAGTGEPSGNGYPTSTNLFTESGLNYSTDYELYVRADCSDEFSAWSGPVYFTTAIQTIYNIVCDTDSPINVIYCYDNNDTIFWQFISDNGFPLELNFNAGTIEGFWDDITIYDGADNTAPVLFNNNANDQDDLAGLVIETTGTSLFIEVDSDGSGSCQSSSFYTEWDFDVVCKTCLTQEANFTVIGECDEVPEFSIEVEITDMGTASSLTVSDGTSTQTAMATGVLTFGPYPSETPTIITVTNSDDASCQISSRTLNMICPPPPNPCSVIYAGEDTSTCEGTSTNLTASYQVLGQDTNTYEINALDSCPQPPASGGEPTSVEIDDRWSDIIDLGFEFCFFGGTYNQILIGSNGVVSFDLTNANGFNGWNIDPGDTIPNSTNSSLADANIFGVAHDIDPSVCGDINYFILGSSPSRQFVVNYTDVCHFSCNELTSSSQIILYESSNTIDVNIFNKPTCATWNDGNALVGVQNPEGTIAFTPEGRNTGVWEATNEFWRFSPSAGAPNFTIEWFDGETAIGNTDTVSVSPTETTTYTAAITYTLCTGGVSTVTDDVVVEILENPEPIAVQDTIVICEGIEVTLEVGVDNSDIPDTITYYWTYGGVDIQVGPENTYTIPEGTSQFGDFIITAIDGNGCYGDTIITVIQGAYPVIEPVEALIHKCINEEATLEVLVSNPGELSDSLTYEWSIDGSVVQSGADSTYLHGIGDSEAIFTVAVIDDVSQCLTETEISVVYYENANCVDIPQGLSPNGDGYNDCLILDHLEDRHDISKAVVFNRYGTKVFELNDYIDQWCGTNQDGEVLPVGTYFYIIYFNSPREPITSWIYLNY